MQGRAQAVEQFFHQAISLIFKLKVILKITVIMIVTDDNFFFFNVLHDEGLRRVFEI